MLGVSKQCPLQSKKSPSTILVLSVVSSTRSFLFFSAGIIVGDSNVS